MTPERAFLPLFDAATHEHALALIREARSEPLTLCFFHHVDAAPHCLLAEAEHHVPGAVLRDGRVHALWGVVLLTKLLKFAETEGLALERMTVLLETFLPRAVELEQRLADEAGRALAESVRERFGNATVPAPWGRAQSALHRAQAAIKRY